MKTLILSLCFTIQIINLVYSQSYTNYYNEIAKAQICEAQKKYTEASIHYSIAFDIEYPFPDDIIDALRCIKHTGNTKSINGLIKLLINSGYKKKEETFLITDLSPNGVDHKNIFPLSEYRNCFDSLYPINRKIFEQQINKKNAQFLSTFKSLEMLWVQMRKRSTCDSSFNYTSQLLHKTIRDLLYKIDESNINISRKHTNTWLDFRFIVCLIHSSQRIMDKHEETRFLSFLKKMVNEGNVHPKQYAMIADAVHSKISGETIYGEMLCNDNNNQLQFQTIADIENIDQRRAEIFLPPLWVKALRKNIELPKKYNR